MPRYPADSGMSALEREYELEMEEEPSAEMEIEAEYEGLEEQEGEPEGEFEEDSSGEMEFEEEPQGEFEAEPSGSESEVGASDYGERFFELSQREFESDSDMEGSVYEVVRDMERDYFLGKVLKGGARQLFRKVKNVVKVHPAFAALKAAAKQLAGPLSGNLGALATAALSAYPGGAALLPVLKSLGFGAGAGAEAGAEGQPQANQEAWNNFAAFAREAYEHMADNITEREVQNPAAATQLASRSLTAAAQALARRQQMRRYRGPVGTAGIGQPGHAALHGHGRRPVYRVRVPRRAIGRGLVIRIEVV